MVTLILLTLSLIIFFPVAMFTLECFLSLLPAIKKKSSDDHATEGTRPRLAVIIPAHNEESGIGNTVGDVKSQLTDTDRVLVVADNCTDNTAEVAQSFGAEVVIRHDLEKRGKSYALEFGLEQLSNDPPKIVIFVDADCRLAANAIKALTTKASTMNRPVQGSYVFGGQDGSAASNLASSLTLRFKNHIRPLGSSRVGMPCQLTGSGMAFPWHTLQQVDIANGSLTEDVELGVDLALMGYPPIFCAQAKIDGSVPKAWDAHVQQRRRWEQGYLESIFTNAPRMFFKSIATGRPSLTWSAFDLCIPPLALLGLLWTVTFMAALVWNRFGGSPLPIYVLSLEAILIATSVLLGWFFHCRHEVRFTSLLAIPWFLVRKITIYFSLLFNREKVWLRTDRD